MPNENIEEGWVEGLNNALFSSLAELVAFMLRVEKLP